MKPAKPKKVVRKGVPLQVYVDPNLREDFSWSCDWQRTTMRAAIESLMREYIDKADAPKRPRR